MAQEDPEIINMGVYEIGNFSNEFADDMDYKRDVLENPYFPGDTEIQNWFKENFEVRMDRYHLYIKDVGSNFDGR